MNRPLRVFGSAVLASAAVGCSVASMVPTTTPLQQATLRFSYDDVYRAAVQQATEMNWSVLLADKDAGLVRLATPWTTAALPDTLSVLLVRSDSGVGLAVRSIVGQGIQRRHARRYVEGLYGRLGATAGKAAARARGVE